MDDKETTAYHEAGHCVAGYLKEPIEHIEFSTIIPDIDPETKKPRLGLTCWKSNSEDDNKALFKASYPGDIAERMLKGDTEITRENAITTKVIKRGPVEEIKLNETGSDFQYSPHGATHAEIYEKVRQLLDEQWPAVDAVAGALLEAKCLEGSEIEQIIDTKKKEPKK